MDGSTTPLEQSSRCSTRSCSPTMRTASSSPTQRVKSPSLIERAIEDLQSRKSEINDRIEELSKECKTKKPFDKEIWRLRKRIAELEIDRSTIDKDIAEQSSNDQSLLKNHEAFVAAKQREISLISTQIKRMETAARSTLGAHHDSFFEPYYSSRSGLDLGGGPGRRGTTVRSEFRSNLIELSDALLEKVRDDSAQNLWCPIEGRYFATTSTIAAHIFPYSGGPALMKSVFGLDEIFSPRNGMLMSNVVEELFKQRNLYLIPDVDLADRDAVARWSSSPNRSWIVRLIGVRPEKLRLIVQSDLMVGDLDYKKVEFRNEFQPRARFLYWHYLCCQLKSKLGITTQVLQENENKVVWATAGRWMGRGMLHAFAAHCGEDFQEAFEDINSADLGIETGAPVEALEFSVISGITQSIPKFESDDDADDFVGFEN